MSSIGTQGRRTYGPVEVLLVYVAGDPFDGELWGSVVEHVDADVIRVLDAVVVTRRGDGGLTVREVEEQPGIGVHPALSGLLAEEDLLEAARDLPIGSSALAIAVEHVWAADLGHRLYELGGSVVYSERVSAPAVNALLEELSCP